MLLMLSACGPTGLSPEETDRMREQISTAREDLKNPDITDEEKVKALESLGFAQDSLNQKNKALKTYEEILKLAQTDFVALNNSAVIYERRGDYETAKKFILVLYVYNKDNQSVVKDAIRIHVEAGDTDQAQTILEEYAATYQSPETTPFISEQFVYIGSHKDGGMMPSTN